MRSLKDKNILYITHTYNNFIKFQVDILARQFKHVYVLMRHKPVAQLATIINIPEIRFHSKEYKMDLKNKPSNVTVIPTPIWYVPFFQYFYRNLGTWHYNSVKKTIKKHKIQFDMVHAHMLWSAGFAGLRISQDFNVPFVVTGHGSDVYKQPFLDSVRRKKITEVLKGATEIITVSQNNARIIQKLGIKKKVHVISNGFNPEKYKFGNKKELREQLELPQNKKIFITVSNLEKGKGNHILLESISNIAKQRDDIYFVIIGGGPEYSRLKAQAKRLGIGEYVRMNNYTPHDMVVKYQLASDYMVLASLNEGVPTVMFEALASGLPFIGTKVGGIPEINREFSGILVEPNDSQLLSQAILKSLDMKWDIKKILDYSKQYTWDSICKKIQDIYENCVRI